MYDELLTLCGFEPEEIERERPRIERAFERFGINDEDVKRGESRIREYYAIELEGVRKLLGVWMKEMIDLALAGDEKRKIIYGEWPGAHTVLMLGAMHEVEDVHFATPVTHVFTIVLSGIFGKTGPILEEGEGLGLPAGSGHCGLWQMHLAAILNGLIPKPDLILTSGYICDQAAEADQLMEDLYGFPVACVDGCLDWQWGELVGERQVKYVAGKLAKVKARIEEVVGRQLSDEAVQKGMGDMMTNFFNHMSVSGAMSADPQPISQSNLDLIYMGVFTPLQHRAQLNEATATLAKEVRQLVSEGKGVVPKGAPKVYMSFRISNQPAVYKMIEEAGLAVPMCLLDWVDLTSVGGPEFTNPLESLVNLIYRSAAVCSSYANIRHNVEICRANNVDGAICFYPFSCRPYTINPLMIRQAIQEELGIPALVMEFGGYDPREYTAGQLRTRVEAFAEMVNMSRAAKVG
jgi:hypothetical protein